MPVYFVENAVNHDHYDFPLHETAEVEVCNSIVASILVNETYRRVLT
jgi:hypothetical protein